MMMIKNSSIVNSLYKIISVIVFKNLLIKICNQEKLNIQILEFKIKNPIVIKYANVNLQNDIELFDRFRNENLSVLITYDNNN